jgi:inner membrane protein
LNPGSPSRGRRIAARKITAPLVPLLLLAIIFGADALLSTRSRGVVLTAALDEPAHFATGALGLIALAGPGWLIRHRTFAISALIGSVVIDVDHIPLYLGWPVGHGGRPYSHSILTFVVLLTVSLVVGRRWPVPLGLGAGVLLHLVRDVVSGPGAPLWWPLSHVGVRVDYRFYAAGLCLTALVVGGRLWWQRSFLAASTGPPSPAADSL